MDDTTLQNCLNLCYVQRWTIAPIIRPQSVAEHTYRVVILLRLINLYLRQAAEPGPIIDMERAILLALDHDSDEAITGDIPGTYKDALGKGWTDPSHLMSWEVAVKVADSLETYDWWYKWGIPHSWIHPNRPSQGDLNRDIRKIKWYTQDWPDILLAVKKVMKINLGYNELFVEGALG